MPRADRRFQDRDADGSQAMFRNIEYRWRLLL
jgi:hypothetical protein